MNRFLSRVMFGLVIALPLALLSFAFVQASAPRQDATPESLNCLDCHGEFQKAWESGAHGRAISDPAFQEAWQAQGSAKECLACHTTGYDPDTGEYEAAGVTCAACHEPVASNHPLAPASMSRSAQLCGECHRDTYLEWQASEHGESDLTCVSCHDPHATGILAKDAAALCASCHGTRVNAFQHSNHAAQGLTCTDCHIGDAEGEASIMGKGQHSHTFRVDLSKCTKCHEYEMHNPAAAMLVPGEVTPTPVSTHAMSSGNPATVASSPPPISPVGFAVLTGLLGLAFGVILAPWLERGFRRVVRHDAAREVTL